MDIHKNARLTPLGGEVRPRPFLGLRQGSAGGGAETAPFGVAVVPPGAALGVPSFAARAATDDATSRTMHNKYCSMDKDLSFRTICANVGNCVASLSARGFA